MTDLRHNRRAVGALIAVAALGAAALAALEQLRPALLRWLADDPAQLRNRLGLVFGLFGAALALPLAAAAAWIWKRERRRPAVRALALALAAAAVGVVLLLLRLYRLMP